MAITTIGYMASIFTVPASTTISVTTNAGGPTTVTIAAGTYRTGDFFGTLSSSLIAQRSVSGGTWDVSFSSGGSVGDTGLVTIGVTNGTFSITWTSTDLRDLLGFASDISSQTSVTGTKQHRGHWLPDCPLYLDSGDYQSAPRVTDLRQSATPTGLVYGHIGNVSYKHSGLRYSHVATDRIWTAQETAYGGVANQSLERFLLDTQWAQGHAWFSPSSRVMTVAHSGSPLGGSVLYWSLVGVGSMEDVVKRIDEWDGRWSASFPQLSSDGSSY